VHLENVRLDLVQVDLEVGKRRCLWQETVRVKCIKKVLLLSANLALAIKDIFYRCCKKVLADVIKTMFWDIFYRCCKKVLIFSS
jgi:hypothetical protein